MGSDEIVGHSDGVIWDGRGIWGDMGLWATWGYIVKVRWRQGSQSSGATCQGVQRDGGRQGEGVTVWCGGYGSHRALGHVQPWGHTHTGLRGPLGFWLMWGYGSGPHLWVQGPPVQSHKKRNALQHCPTFPLFTQKCSPHPPVPPMSSYNSIPPCPTCSQHPAYLRAAFCPRRLCFHIQPMSLYPP